MSIRTCNYYRFSDPMAITLRTAEKIAYALVHDETVVVRFAPVNQLGACTCHLEMYRDALTVEIEIDGSDDTLSDRDLAFPTYNGLRYMALAVMEFFETMSVHVGYGFI